MSEGAAQPELRFGRAAGTRGIARRMAPWLALVSILFAYVIAVVRLNPENFFGYSNDDMIYFSSARAITQGEGYVLPSIPGSPAATKYPILLPWLLSFVWWYNPTFPANVKDAIWVILAFGCAFIALCFTLLRRLAGLSDPEALLLTAICALHPTILFYSASILSDIPFAALALAGIISANWATSRNKSLIGPATSGILMGLSTLMRVAGIPLAAGIFLVFLLRRAWRQSVAFALSTAPFLAVAVRQAVFRNPILPAVHSYQALPGWEQTWLYYTDYVGFRTLVFSDGHQTWSMALNQFLYLCTDVPGYFIGPLFFRNGGLAVLSTLVVLWLIVSGMILQSKGSGLQPAHAALFLYLALFLTWDYPDWSRFLILFLPFFAAGLWLKGKWVVKELWSWSLRRRSKIEKLVSRAVATAMIAMSFGIVFNLGAGQQKLVSVSRERGALLQEKREAYNWLRENSPARARVIATEDASLYLYTERQAMGQIAFLPTGTTNPARLKFDLDHLTDVARAIGADYWLASPDDSAKHWKAARLPLEARLEEIEGVLPPLFRSNRGHVVVYGLGCVQHPNNDGCRAADRVLFPGSRD